MLTGGKHIRRPSRRIMLSGQEECSSSSSSGVDGFSSLLNRDEHILLKISIVNKRIDEFGFQKLYLIGEQTEESFTIKRNSALAEAEADGKPLKIHVILRDQWAETPVHVGMRIRLIEPRRVDENRFELRSSDPGLLVLEPETLISSTALAQSLYCARKALFQDRFRSAGSTLAMTVGIVAHELFQIALQHQSPASLSADWLFRLYRKRFLPAICLDLIAMQCALERFEEELLGYLDNIAHWIKTYLPHLDSNSQSEREVRQSKPIAKVRHFVEGEENSLSEPLYYERTHDIEENVWTPTIGLKGRIDVSFVGTNVPPILTNGQHQGVDCGAFVCHSNKISRPTKKEMVIPLELKTGKSYGSSDGSVEHQSQVLLYTLMLSEKANAGRIGHGFLLYMRDNSLVQVQPKAAKLHGLIQMRNRLAADFSRFTLDSFPPPLDNPRCCKLCPFNALCGTLALCSSKATEVSKDADMEDSRMSEDSVILVEQPAQISNDDIQKMNLHSNSHICEEQLKTEENEEGEKENIPCHEREEVDEEQEQLPVEMLDFFSASAVHLSEAERAYARRWIRWTLREWEHAWKKGTTVRLFREGPEQREARGQCVANLRLVSCTQSAGNESNHLSAEANAFLLRFERHCVDHNDKTRPADEVVLSQPFGRLEPGSVVTLSTDTAFAVLMATIHSVDVASGSITLIADKSLPPSLLHHQFHLDKHEGFTHFALSLGNIAALLQPTPNAKRIRSILLANKNGLLGDENMLAEDENEDWIRIARNYFGERSFGQRQIDDLRGILHSPHGFALYRHLTKIASTDALVSLIRLFLELGKSVLFCASNNSNVDEVLAELIKHVPAEKLIRIGNRKAVSPELAQLLIESKLAETGASEDDERQGEKAKADGLEQVKRAKADELEQDKRAKADGLEQDKRAKADGLEQDKRAKADGLEQDKRAKADGLEQDIRAKAFYARMQTLAFQTPLVACTAHSVASHSFFATSRIYDFCVLGDAHLMLDSLVIAPLLRARRFFLFGMEGGRKKSASISGPIVRDEVARSEGMALPLIDRLECREHEKDDRRSGPLKRMLDKQSASNSNELEAEGRKKERRIEEPKEQKQRVRGSGTKRRPMKTLTLVDMWRKRQPDTNPSAK